MRVGWRNYWAEGLHERSRVWLHCGLLCMLYCGILCYTVVYYVNCNNRLTLGLWCALGEDRLRKVQSLGCVEHEQSGEGVLSLLL